jgi:hypothetical protein
MAEGAPEVYFRTPFSPAVFSRSCRPPVESMRVAWSEFAESNTMAS